MNDKQIEVYQRTLKLLQTPKSRMTLYERVELQQSINAALYYDLSDSDRDDFLYHQRTFESDMFLIASRMKLAILTQTATIQIAINRISKIFDAGGMNNG